MSDLKITAEGIPEDVDARLLITVYPETTKEFERMAEAAGDVEFRAQTGGFGVSADIDGGKLLLGAPPQSPAPRPDNPFIREFLAERGQS